MHQGLRVHKVRRGPPVHRGLKDHRETTGRWDYQDFPVSLVFLEAQVQMVLLDEMVQQDQLVSPVQTERIRPSQVRRVRRGERALQVQQDPRGPSEIQDQRV